MKNEDPKYEQIADDVRRKIIQRTYEQNQQLPLERDMEKTYNVSRITIKKAIDILVEEGFVVKRRGSGTFVKSFDSTQLSSDSTRYQGFSEQYANHDVSSDVDLFTIEKATPELATKLHIKNNDFVYHIKRLRLVDKKPITYQITYIPINLLLGLRFDSVVDSLYSFVTDTAGLKIQSAHRNISASTASDDLAEKLHIASGAPILKIESTVFLDSGQIFEYTISNFRSDKYSYNTIELR